MTNSEIIRQYVDTGMCIPEHQVNKLSPNLLKTYLRKRIIAAQNADPDISFFAYYEYSIMDKENLKKSLLTGFSPDIITARDDNFLNKLKGMIFEEKGDLNLHELSSIPTNVKFNNDGNVNLHYTTSVSEGVEFNNNGLVDLDRVKTILVKEFNNKGNVSLDSLKYIKHGIIFNNVGDVSLFELLELSEDVKFLNKGTVDLSTLEKLPKKFKFENEDKVLLGSVYFEFERGIEYDIQFNNGGDVDLDSDFEYLPEGVTFNNGGCVIFYHAFDYSKLTEKQAENIYPKLRKHDQLRFRLKRNK
jgi:hypothetical protein